jgi:RNA polymerase sigma-70 factor (ECF subfamily)
MSDVPSTDESEAATLCAQGAFDAAATWVLRQYGGEILRYLASVERTSEDANDVFSEFCVALWQSLPRFRAECSLRTYAYALAQRQRARSLRKRARRREVALSSEAEALVFQARTSTAEYLRSSARHRLAQLCEGLADEDRALLVLRLDRKLGWIEIARVMLDDDDASDGEVTRRSAALRKRYERLKEQFRRQLHSDA